MTLPWEDNKELIIQLYIRDRRRLVDVRDIMRQHHNFRASVRSYRQHFDRWKVGKYRCRRRQWERPDSPGLGSGNGEMMAVSSTPPPLRHPLSPASSSTTEIFPPAPYPVDPSLSMGPAMGYSFLTQAGRGYGSGGSNKSNNNGNVIGEPYHSPFNDYAQFVSQQPLYGHSPRYPDQGCFHPSVHHSYVGMESAYDHPHMPFPNRRTWSIRNSLSSDSDGHREFEDTSASP